MKKEQQHFLYQLTTTSEPSGTSEKEQQHSQSPIAAMPMPYTYQQASLNLPSHNSQRKKQLLLRQGLKKGMTCTIPDTWHGWNVITLKVFQLIVSYSLIPVPSHSQDGHETPSLSPHFSSVDPTDALQFSDETTPSPTVSTPLRSDLPRRLRPLEAMPSPVVSTPLSNNRLGSFGSSGTTSFIPWVIRIYCFNQVRS